MFWVLNVQESHRYYSNGAYTDEELFLFVLLSHCLICGRSLHYSCLIFLPVERNNRGTLGWYWFAEDGLVLFLWSDLRPFKEKCLSSRSCYLCLKYRIKCSCALCHRWNPKSFLFIFQYCECSKSKRKYKSGSFDGVSGVLRIYECWD